MKKLLLFSLLMIISSTYGQNNNSYTKTIDQYKKEQKLGELFDYLKATIKDKRFVQNAYLNTNVIEELADCYDKGIGTQQDKKIAKKLRTVILVKQGAHTPFDDEYYFKGLWADVLKIFEYDLRNSNILERRFLFGWLLLRSDNYNKYTGVKILTEYSKRSNLTDVEIRMTYESLNRLMLDDNDVIEVLISLEKRSKRLPKAAEINNYIMSILLEIINQNN